MKYSNLSFSRTFGHVPTEVTADIIKTSAGNVLTLVKDESEALKLAK